MVTIDSVDRGLQYVSHLGFTEKPGYAGWIVRAQIRMRNVECKLWLAANKAFPYTVHYTRKDKVFTVNGKAKVNARGL